VFGSTVQVILSATLVFKLLIRIILRRVPEFAGKIVQQGVVKKLEIGLHTMTGFCNVNIREKVQLCVSLISSLTLIRSAHRLCTPMPGFLVIQHPSPLSVHLCLLRFLDCYFCAFAMVAVMLDKHQGMLRELQRGTKPSKYTVIQMMLNLHNCYAWEEEFVTSTRDILLELMNTGIVCIIY